MHQIVATTASDSRIELVLHGFWNGVKAFPVAFWHALPHHNLGSAYHVAYILGLIFFVVLVVFACRRLP